MKFVRILKKTTAVLAMLALLGGCVLRDATEFAEESPVAKMETEEFSPPLTTLEAPAEPIPAPDAVPEPDVVPQPEMIPEPEGLPEPEPVAEPEPEPEPVPETPEEVRERRIAEELAQQGRRGIIWGDQLLDATAWDPKLYAAKSRPDQKTHLALEKLDRRLIIADWHYRISEPEVPTARHFRDHGFDVLTCPWDGPTNAQALHTGAEKEGLMGSMDTTWHHMDPMLSRMPEIGSSAWLGAAYEPNPGQWAHCSALLRKLMPVARSFAKAGYKTHEIDANYCSLLCCPH